MTSGIENTGPYGKIRKLRNEIRAHQYEIRLIQEGLRRKSKREIIRRKDCIQERQKQIRDILAAEKAKKIGNEA